MNREARKKIAQETVAIIERGRYDTPSGKRITIADDIQFVLEYTRLYTPDELTTIVDNTRAVNNKQLSMDACNETTLSAASRLINTHARQKLLCLNFASAKSPGGGFLGGSQAREESLARSSALYASLISQSRYYETNRACGTSLYTHHMIYSPNVPAFRDDGHHTHPI